MISENKIDIATFKKFQSDMVAKNDNSWNEAYNSFTRDFTPARDYSLNEVYDIINSGNIEALQNLSRNYFARDGYYKRTLIYYATLLKYCGILIPNPAYGQNLSTPHLSKRYYSALGYVDQLNLQNIFINCSMRALVDGYYYGYIQKLDKDGFVLIDLPTQYCRSNFKDLYGNDVVEFNVNYFNTILDEQVRAEVLKLYPQDVTTRYKRYIKGKASNPWVILMPPSAFCFQLYDGRPPFLSMIPSTIQYEDAVETERERDIEEIRKILVQKIPHLNDGQLLFEPEEAVEMHAGAVGMMKGNKNISVLTTYADVDSIVSKTSADTASNNLEKMKENIYSEGSVSSQIFSPTGYSAVETSIKNDMAFMMPLAFKYSSLVKYIVNNVYGNSNISFSYQILPITYYNESEYFKNALDAARSGYSLLLPAIALGISQRDLLGLKELENDILKLGEKLIPLASSYTQSGTTSTGNSVGRPPLSPEQKSVKTVQNEQSINNTGGSVT